MRKNAVIVLSFAVIAAITCTTAGASAHEDEYPMSGATYRARFDERITRYRDRFEHQLDEHRVAADKREFARKKLGMVDAILRATVANAVQDGTVTQAEAHAVRDLSKWMREDLYRSVGLERGKGE